MTIIEDTTARNRAWINYARALFERTTIAKYATGEDIRLALEENGILQPANPNIWGLFIADLARRGLIKPTGGYAPTVSAPSHGRKVQIYSI